VKIIDTLPARGPYEWWQISPIQGAGANFFEIDAMDTARRSFSGTRRATHYTR